MRCFTNAQEIKTNSKLKVTTCDQPETGFENTTYGSIKQISSGYCFHPYHGSQNPSEGTYLVLYNECKSKKTWYTFEQGKTNLLPIITQ